MALIVASTLSLGQSKESFRKALGPPVGETYLDNGIAIIVRFDSHGDVCQIHIAPEENTYYPMVAMTEQQLDSVMASLPPIDKGKRTTGGIINGICGQFSCSGSVEAYEHETISRTTLPDSSGKMAFAEIVYRRNGCDSLRASESKEAPK